MRLTLILLSALILSACASSPEKLLPENAEQMTRTDSSGDTITEYRVNGALTMVKVVPSRGPTFYIYDRNGDGLINERDAKDGPMTYYKLFSW